MNALQNKIYVTRQLLDEFQDRSWGFGDGAAVACDTIAKAQEVADLVNSYDNARDINITTTGIEECYTVLPYGHPTYRLDSKNVTYEVCPCCEYEVELSHEMKAHRCPSCGKYIMPCSICQETDCDWES